MLVEICRFIHVTAESLENLIPSVQISWRIRINGFVAGGDTYLSVIEVKCLEANSSGVPGQTIIFADLWLAILLESVTLRLVSSPKRDLGYGIGNNLHIAPNSTRDNLDLIASFRVEETDRLLIEANPA